MTREELKEILKESLSIRIVESGNLGKTIADDFSSLED